MVAIEQCSTLMELELNSGCDLGFAEAFIACLMSKNSRNIFPSLAKEAENAPRRSPKDLKASLASLMEMFLGMLEILR